MRNTTSVIKNNVIKWRFSTYWDRAGGPGQKCPVKQLSSVDK